MFTFRSKTTRVAPDPQNAPLAFLRPLRGISDFALGSWVFGADHGLRSLRARTKAALAAAKARGTRLGAARPAGAVRCMLGYGRAVPVGGLINHARRP